MERGTDRYKEKGKIENVTRTAGKWMNSTKMTGKVDCLLLVLICEVQWSTYGLKSGTGKIIK